MSTTQKAPGLKLRTRSNGAQIAYWVARPDLIKAGYRPKSVRLHYELDDPLLVARCHTLQAEMLEWAADSGVRPAAYDGTFASLVRMYESDPDSPYFELEESTQASYSKTMASLMKHKGARRIEAVTGADVKRWYKELVEARSKSWGYYSMNVLKAILSYGATRRLKECLTLRSELALARFKAGPRRTTFLTYEQVAAFRPVAHAMGYGWMALCLTLQFDLGFRRRDVIGRWVRDRGSEAGIRHNHRVWGDGLTWGDIDEHGILRRLVSKTAKTTAIVAVHAIADYPDVMAELARIPLDRRVGPIVLDNKGIPPNEAQCRWTFRRVARECGIPDEVQNMDARAGADTEAYESGATEEESMALLTHSDRKNSRRYLRDLTEQSRRAAAKRLQSRGKE